MSLEMTFSITHTSFPTRAIFSPASLFYRTSDLLTIKILRSKGCVMAQQKKEFLTDEAVEEEIARLRQSPYVKLAQKEERIRNRRRHFMHVLRMYEKKGRLLVIAPDDTCGVTTLKHDDDCIMKLYHKGYKDAELIMPFLEK